VRLLVAVVTVAVGVVDEFGLAIGYGHVARTVADCSTMILISDRVRRRLLM
jgi:hypothetical protein